MGVVRPAVDWISSSIESPHKMGGSRRINAQNMYAITASNYINKSIMGQTVIMYNRWLSVQCECGRKRATRHRDEDRSEAAIKVLSSCLKMRESVA